jgi:hypothetical protein
LPKPKDIFDQRSGLIVENLDQMTKDLLAIQKEIAELLTVDLFASMITKDGALVFNNENLLVLNEIFAFFQSFEKLQEFEKQFAGQLYDITLQSKQYFTAFETVADKVKKISKGMDPLYRAIGLSKEGKIIPDGFLSKLFSTQSELLQNDVKNYVIESLANQSNYKEFLSGFKQLIEGNEVKDGKLLHYYRQYAYDVHTKVARLTDDYFATQLGLNYAVYSGTEMKTSRPFCKGGEDKYHGHFDSKIGKVFSREEMLKWKEIPMWEGKYPVGDEYNPLMDMGGANCHHLPRWITDDLIDQFD